MISEDAGAKWWGTGKIFIISDGLMSKFAFLKAFWVPFVLEIISY